MLSGKIQNQCQCGKILPLLFILTLFGKLLPLEPSAWRFLAGLIACSCVISPSAVAQIIPDNTLGDESSVVVPEVEINGIESDILEGGAIRGSNLFHSFQEFNIDAGRGAYFANPAAIENIFSRVTGVNPSEIFGTLGVLGNANLFLINPNGIIFGKNASLDLRGSFVGTTADSIVFRSGKEFSATNPGVPPLLTVNVEQPIGLKFEGESGIITNAADLAVASLQTLSLSGNEVSTTGNLTAPGGRVELLGTETVALLEDGTIDVSSDTGGGTVLIGGDFQGRGTVPNAKRTYVDDNFTINADALANGNGGRVIVWADEVTGFYGNISARGGLESGDGGLVEVSGKEQLIFRGNVDTSAVNGLPGTLLLDSTNIIIGDGTGDGTDTFEGNNSGVVGSILTAPLSEIDDTAPTTIYESELERLSGDTNIILQATNDITLQDLTDDSLELAAGAGVIAFSADADGDGVGDFVMEDNVADTIFTNGRDIAISGASLNIGNIDTSLLVAEAGQLIETARIVSDSPGVALESISGNISNSEDVDLFQIYLTGGGTFSASTDNPETDTQLFLFDADGLGVYANIIKRCPFCPSQATLPAGNVLTPTEPGIYYLGISTVNGNAVSSEGEIFPSSLFVAIRGANGATDEGGLSPLSGWLEGSDTGSYRINLTGVEAAEANIIESIQPTGASGAVTLNATDDININGLVDTSGNLGDGGAVNITTGSLFLTNGARIASGINAEGNGGAISITAADSVNISGDDSEGNVSGIFSEIRPRATGKAGSITIDTGSLSLTDGARLSATTRFRGIGDAGAINITANDSVNISGESSFISGEFSIGEVSGIFSEIGAQAEGNSGGITIDSNSLSLMDGARISSSTFGVGNGAAIAISATRDISLSGDSSLGNLNVSSILSEVGAGAEGKAGDITIDTSSLSLMDGAKLSTSTFGVGDSGVIKIAAPKSVTLSGEFRENVSGIFSEVEGARGNSGGISIDTGSLSLTDGAQVSASTSGLGDAGAIKIAATDAITLSGENSEGLESVILSRVEIGGEGNSGDITINTGSLSLTEGAELSASTFGVGDAGAIKITATDSITLSGEDKQGFGSRINSQVASGAQGAGGDITIDTNFLSLTEGAQLNAEAITIRANDTITMSGESTEGLFSGIISQIQSGTTGNSEGINIKTDSLSLSGGARLSASTFGVGDAGAIKIVATDAIILSGESSRGFVSGIFSQVGENATGNSGGITIDTGSLSLINGALVSASTFGVGDARTISIFAKHNITLSGEDSEGLGSGISSTVQPDAKGIAEGITINTASLSLADGAQLGASTFGVGNAGEIKITAKDTIILLGESNRAPSGIFSTVEATAEGDSQGIIINTGSLSLTDGAEVSANTRGGGKAGDILITANTLQATTGSQIQTNTTSNFDAADITLEISDNLLLSGAGSGLFAQTEGGGNAGNIIINSPQLTINQGASISAFTTASGDGGTITINAPQAVLLTDNSQLTVETTSEGKSGDITITTPNLTIGKDSEISASATATSTNTKGGSSITISTSNLDLTGKLGIFAETQGVAPAGTLNIQPDENKPNLDIEFTDTAIISASTTASGKGGDINLTAPETIDISGQGKIAVETIGSGDAGSINITAQQINVSNQTEISASTSGTGSAGSILIKGTESVFFDNSSIFTTINADAVVDTAAEPSNIEIKTSDLSLTNNSQVSASTAGVGNAGEINLEARETLSIENSIVSGAVEQKAVGNAGNVSLNAPSISVTENSALSTATNGKGNAGEVTVIAEEEIVLINSTASSAIQAEGEGTAGTVEVKANQITLSGTELSSSTAGVGDANSVIIEAKENLSLRNTTVSSAVEQGAVGNAGNVSLTAPSISITENSTLSTITNGEGNAGEVRVIGNENILIRDSTASSAIQGAGTGEQAGIVEVKANQITLSSAELSSSTAGVGDANSVIIEAKENLSLRNTTVSSAVEQGAIGNAGNVSLTAPLISITNNSTLSTATDGKGNAGEVTVSAEEDISIINSNLSSAIQAQGEGEQAGIVQVRANQIYLSGTELSSSTRGTGNAGSIDITANNFNLREGAKVITNTFSSGKAGDIQLQIRDELNLVDSSITASTQEESSGNGGSIFIDPQVVTLNNSQIAVNSQGTGIGGNINLQADTLSLENQSAITAETVSTDGGDIDITLSENLVLRDKSSISATAGTNEAGGNGGNIDINAQFILAFPTEDSDITANAFLGNGGKISITAEGILGIEFRLQPTILSDITASSELGLAGTVDINTPETDPNRGLVTLPQQEVDTQVALGCDVDGEGAVAFYNLGRGGLSTSPDDFLIPDTVIGEWLPLVPRLESFAAEGKLSFELSPTQQQAKVVRQFVPPCWQ